MRRIAGSSRALAACPGGGSRSQLATLWRVPHLSPFDQQLLALVAPAAPTPLAPV